MSESSSTAIPEAAKASSTAQPPVQDINAAAEKESDRAGVMGDRVVRAVGGGSPETPPDRYAGALGQLSGRSQAGMLRQLQRSYGNSYVGAVIQRKADGSGSCSECEKKEKEIQRKGEGDVSSVPDEFEATMQRSGTGQPLDEGTRSFMESRFDRDFGDVKVHTDSAAAEAAEAVRAQAFTVGRDIYFGRGRFLPQATEGKKLIAHELTHTLQQISSFKAKSVVSSPDDLHEQEADRIADQIAKDKNFDIERDAVNDAGSARRSHIHLSSVGTPTIQRQPLPTSGIVTTVPLSPNKEQLPIPGSPSGENPKILLPPLPKGELVLHTGSNLTFTDDIEYVRFQIEMFAAAQGINKLDILTSKDELFIFGSGLGPFFDRPKPATPERTDYLKRVVKLVQSDVKAVKAKINEFREDFQRRAVDTTWKLLDESKARIEKERDRYGIKEGKMSGEDNKETADVVSAARALLDKQQIVVAAKKQLDDALEFGPHGELPPGGLPDKAHQQKEIDARNKLSDAQREYNLLRNREESNHPILVSYQLEALADNTPEILKALASGSNKATETLAAEIKQKLENIEEVRQKVGSDRALIWKLPSIVESTKQLRDIQSYPKLSQALRETIIIEEIASAEASEAIVKLALGALALTLGLLAAVPTGGLSVGAAMAVTAAGVAEGGLMIALGYEAYQEFSFKQAAAGTDFDKAKAISQEEPSLFWLALDIVGAVAGVGGMTKGVQAFRRLAALRRVGIAAKTAGRVEEAEAALSALQKEGNALEEGKQIGNRLRQEVEGTVSALEQDFQEIRANLKEIKPSTIEGYTHEIPLGKNRFWRRSPEGQWCLFASPAKCFPDLLDPLSTSIDEALPTSKIRQQSGRVTGGNKLPEISGRWFDPTKARVAPLPNQIAQRMKRIGYFNNWDDFRQTFWKLVEQDPVLRVGWSNANLARMRQGLAPFVEGSEAVGGGSNAVFQLNHIHPLEYGGSLFDLNNIEIVSPRFHVEIAKVP